MLHGASDGAPMLLGRNGYEHVLLRSKTRKNDSDVIVAELEGNASFVPCVSLV